MSKIAVLLEESKHKRTLKFLVSVSFAGFNGLENIQGQWVALLLVEASF